MLIIHSHTHGEGSGETQRKRKHNCLEKDERKSCVFRFSLAITREGLDMSREIRRLKVGQEQRGQMLITRDEFGSLVCVQEPSR